MITSPFSTPDFIQRGKTTTLARSIYEDGVQVVPSSVALNLLDENSITVLDAVACAVAVSGGITYELPAVVTADRELSEYWLEEWVATMADGEVVTIRRDAALVRRQLYPVVTEDDLLARHSDLGKLLPAGVTTWATVLASAWAVIELELLSKGHRPNLVTNAWAFKLVHELKTLELIFRDSSTYSAGGSSKYGDLATYYATAYAAAWDKIPLKYDSGDTGLPSDAVEAPTSPVLYLKGV